MSLSSNMGKRARKEIITRIREEGRQAFRDGKKPQQNPYKYMDAFQWSNGYEDAQTEYYAQHEEHSALYVAYNALMAADFELGEGRAQRAQQILHDALCKLNSEYTKDIQKEVFKIA